MSPSVQDSSRGRPKPRPPTPRGLHRRRLDPREGSAPPTATSPCPGIAGLPALDLAQASAAPDASRSPSLPVALVALILSLGPGIDESKDERARAEARSARRSRAERVAEIRAEQRPRLRRGTPAGTDLALRTALAGTPSRRHRSADARARVEAGALDGPIRSVRASRIPRSVDGAGAHLDPAGRHGRYSCLAVTREVARDRVQRGGR